MPKRHGDYHHLVPGSRIREAISLLPVKISNIIRNTELNWRNKRKKLVEKHCAWHFLFNNRLPCEAINMIETGRVRRQYDIEGKGLSQEDIDKLRIMEEKWQEVFGAVFKGRAVTIIKKRWTPRDSKGKCSCFQFKECFEFHNPKKICPLLGLRVKKKKKKKKLIRVKLGRRN